MSGSRSAEDRFDDMSYAVDHAFVSVLTAITKAKDALGSDSSVLTPLTQAHTALVSAVEAVQWERERQK